MGLQRPKSMSELDYYTRRAVGNGKVEVWVFKQNCSCGGLFRKPKKSSSVYVCEKCKKEVDKKEYESNQTACISYTCPKCGKSGEKQESFKRKKVGIMINGKRKQVESFQFECDSCGQKINVTKKLK